MAESAKRTAVIVAAVRLFLNSKEKRRYFMEDKKDIREEIADEQEKPQLSETWAEDALADLEDFIEEQGIYIRQ